MEKAYNLKQEETIIISHLESKKALPLIIDCNIYYPIDTKNYKHSVYLINNLFQLYMVVCNKHNTAVTKELLILHKMST